MQRSFLHCILFVLCCHNSEAQPERIMPLKIGNYIPDIHFENVIGSNQKENGFGQLKGKLVILDFWNVRCKGCLHAMPHLDSLQKKFQDKLQIILVTENNLAEINGLFSKIKIKFPDLPCIINDTVFNNLFPHEGEPFQAWIGMDGKVKYLTSDYNASSENIEAVIKGKELSISNLDLLNEFDYRKPLFVQKDDQLLSLAENYSLLMRGMHRYERNTVIRFEKDSLSKKTIRFTAINVSILTLFQLAFSSAVFGYDLGSLSAKTNNRIIYQTRDSISLFPPIDRGKLDEWKKENLVSYELEIPANATYDIYSVMQEEVNRFFSIEGKIEERKINCLVLIDSSHGSIKTKTGEPRIEYGKNYFKIQNQPLDVLTRELQSSHFDLKTPIISGYTGQENVDMLMNCNLADLNAVQKELRRYGLKLAEQERAINMLVLKEKK